MTQEQKVIRAKVGVLELTKQLGNVSQACKMMIVATVSTFWRCRTLRPTTQPGYGFLIQPMRKPDAYPEIVDAPDQRS